MRKRFTYASRINSGSVKGRRVARLRKQARRELKERPQDNEYCVVIFFSFFSEFYYTGLTIVLQTTSTVNKQSSKQAGIKEDWEGGLNNFDVLGSMTYLEMQYLQ